MSIFSNKSKLIKLSELSEELGFTDLRSTKKWLKELSIEFWKQGREFVAFQWDVEFALQLKRVEHLQKKFPAEWYEIYLVDMKDNEMLDTVLTVYPPKDLRGKEKIKIKKQFFK